MGRKTLILALTALVLAAGCGTPERRPAGRASSAITLETPKPTTKATVVETRPKAPTLLRAFRDCAAVTADLKAQAIRYVGPYGLPTAYGSGGGRVVAMEASAAGGDRAASAPAPQAGSDYSETNVQEAGVDEPDTVKTDGRHIFAVAGQTVRAAAVGNGKPRLVGRLNLKGYGSELLLSGNRLLVLSRNLGVPEPMMMRAEGPGASSSALGPQSTVEVVDVSNPSAMRVVTTVRLDGDYVAARQIDGVARIVLQRPGPAIGLTHPQSEDAAALQRALASNKNTISRAGIGQWIPRYRIESGRTVREGALSSCTQTYRPVTFSGFGSVTVVTLDPRLPTPRGGATVVGSGNIVYASRNSLYVTSQRVPAPQPFVPGHPMEFRPLPDQTQIHKFGIGSPSATYDASGIVSGSPLNQFALSEHEDRLRIATTTNPFSDTPTQVDSRSAVSVLEERGSQLVQVGKVDNLGVGQRIYAVRFVGPVAYVVTFRQIDPLYTIDLTQPTRPRVRGELHIPGFSSYLHPISEGLLMGVGTEVDANGRVVGTKVSLFDVSNLAKPRELQKLNLGGPNFQIQFDHHAFLWWARSNLAVLPLQTYSTDGKGTFNGAVTIKVEDGRRMRELKRLTQPESDTPGVPITRSLVAASLLFTLSERGLMANELDSLDQTAWLPFQN